MRFGERTDSGILRAKTTFGSGTAEEFNGGSGACVILIKTHFIIDIIVQCHICALAPLAQGVAAQVTKQLSGATGDNQGVGALGESLLHISLSNRQRVHQSAKRPECIM